MAFYSHYKVQFLVGGVGHIYLRLSSGGVTLADTLSDVYNV